MSKILLIEDDLSLVNGLTFAFHKQGYIDDYNRLRPHEALNYATPDAVYYASFRVA